MIKENIPVQGKLKIVLKDKDGNVKDSREVKNLIVDDGLDMLASIIGTGSGTPMSHMGVGAGTTAAANTDTGLESAIGSRTTLDSTTVTNNTVQYVASFGVGENTGAITEAGIFNASTGANTMFNRTTFAVVNKEATDSLTLTWTITFSAN